MPRPVYFLDGCCRVDVDEEGEIEGVTMFVTFDLDEIPQLPETLRSIAELAIETGRK